MFELIDTEACECKHLWWK